MKAPWVKLSTEAISGRPAIGFVQAALKVCEEQIGPTLFEDDFEPDKTASARVDSVASILSDPSERSWAVTVGHVLIDLRRQGWTLSYEQNHIWGIAPEMEASREILRARLHVRRDQQLAEPSVIKFLDAMEQWRSHRGFRKSVLSLMRDGRDLAKALTQPATDQPTVQPYIQFVTATARCDHTGLRLLDIWRYFRHTWANPYESVPGRSMLMLVRDASAANHPVMGLAALSSAAIRLGPRDRFIGWDTDQVVGRLVNGPRSEMMNWAHGVVRQALNEIYIVDLVRERVLPTDEHRWSMEHVDDLRRMSVSAREVHHRTMEGQSYKSIEPQQMTGEEWAERAEMPLFRSKRLADLASLIELRVALVKADAQPEQQPALPSDVLSRFVKIARSKTVGTEIADLTVCGAIAPYSHLAAGKLIALLATSPAAVAEYYRRYSAMPGIISSSLAGRPITRPANLVYVGTTSLYGRRPNQYDRISMPASIMGGSPKDHLRYQHIKDDTSTHTAGIGTFQFSSVTLRALEAFVTAEKGGWRVNNVFGEGTSPKLRGLRDGFTALGLDSHQLLVHGIEKCIYGVRLAKNVDRYLLGLDEQPQWVLSRTTEDGGVGQVSEWWFSRWAIARAARLDVQLAIKKETMVHPIRHSARVPRPQAPTRQDQLFDV